MGEKDKVKWLEGSVIDAPRYIILLYILVFVIITILIFVGLHIIGGYEVSEGYNLFRDILVINLTILCLAMTALGYEIYQRILKHAEKSMKEKEEEFLLYSKALLFLNMGYFHWQHYEIDYEKEVKEENKQEAYALQEEHKKKAYALHHRKLAIELTEDAYTLVLKLDENDQRNERLKCQIMNNLGWYLAEGDEKKEFSKRCAQYLIKRIDKFPEKGEEWQHTINKII
jgi:hypothetical protein